jgi:pimeloyl-ACP methyl ester carboxylesterase
MAGDPDEGLWRAPPRRRIDSRAARRRRGRLAAALAAAAVAAAVLAVVLTRPADPRHGSVALRPCPLADGLSGLCGTVPVPLDPGDPGGRTIALRVAVLPATGRRDGAVFWLEGGPGGAGTRSALAVSTFLGRVERTRDLVLIDQRGTGGSAAATCPAPPRAGPLAAWLRRCLATHPDARFLTSDAAADDVDAVRRALGYGRVDLVGASYGATLAQLVAERHPDAVRTLVLDAATPLGVAVYAREPATAARSLAAVVAECEALPRCRRAYPRLAAEVRVGLRGGPGVGAARAAATVEALLRTTDGQAVVPYDLDRAARGNLRPLAEDFKTYVGTGLDRRLRLAMAWEIQCREPWARLGPPGSGFFAPAARARDALLRSGCAAVTGGPASAQAAPPIAARALVLAGSTDPQSAPYAALWRRLLPRSRLLVVPGGAHGVAGVGCLPALVARFLERGDAVGLDTRCARRPVVPSFQLR